MARTKKGAARAASTSLFVWVRTGPLRRRLMTRRQAEARGFKVEGNEAVPQSSEPKPTKKQLLERAAELNVDLSALGKRPKNDDIAAAIAEAEGGSGE